MPKVNMQTSMSGPGVNWRRGETVDVEKATADRLVDAGFAQPVVTRRKRETATVDAPETTEGG